MTFLISLYLHLLQVWSDIYLIISTFTTGMVWHLSHYIYVYYRYGLTFIVTSGGYRELVNIGDGSITGVEFYNGVSVQDTLEFKFDFDVPVHCIQSASCTENPMKLEKDVTTVTIVTKTILFHLCCMKNETNNLICNHCICNTWFLFYPPRLINVFLCIISIKQCITFGIFCFFCSPVIILVTRRAHYVINLCLYCSKIAIYGLNITIIIIWISWDS